MARDFGYVADQVGLRRYFESEDFEMTKNPSSSDAGATSRAKKYFAMLNPNLRRRLVELYRKDFELFEYEVPDYAKD